VLAAALVLALLTRALMPPAATGRA
jgi:hypothetical protein